MVLIAFEMVYIIDFVENQAQIKDLVRRKTRIGLYKKKPAMVDAVSLQGTTGKTNDRSTE